MTDFESDRDYYRKIYNTQYKRPRYSRPNFSALAAEGKPTCRPGYKLMKDKTGRWICKASAPQCKPGYSLRKEKKTGRPICVKNPYPWMVFPRFGGPFGLVGSVGRVGNFIFMVLMIGIIIYFAPTIMRAITSIAKGSLDVYGKWKEVKSIPTKDALGGD